MKKLIVLLLSAVMLFGITACTLGGDKDGINVYMPDGATALSLAYMMANHGEIDGEKVNYNVVPPSTIRTYVENEKADMIILPSNAAVGLYNLGANYKIAAVMTHGNLFIIGKEATSLQDLAGSVIAVIGSGSIPELVLRALLKRLDIEVVVGDTAVDGKASFIYVDEGSEARTLLVAEKVQFAFIAEPAATGIVNALKDSHGLQQLFNIQDEWKNAMAEEGKDYSNGFPQAVLFVKTSLNRNIVDSFLQKCKEGDGWAQDNAADAVQAIKDNALSGTASSMPSVSAAIIAKCNIKTVTDGLEEYVGDFLSTLKIYNPTSVIPKNTGIYY